MLSYFLVVQYSGGGGAVIWKVHCGRLLHLKVSSENPGCLFCSLNCKSNMSIAGHCI